MEEIAYINAHATSTPVGDLNEAKAIAEVFGSHKGHVPVPKLILVLLRLKVYLPLTPLQHLLLLTPFTSKFDISCLGSSDSDVFLIPRDFKFMIISVTSSSTQIGLNHKHVNLNLADC